MDKAKIIKYIIYAVLGLAIIGGIYGTVQGLVNNHRNTELIESIGADRDYYAERLRTLAGIYDDLKESYGSAIGRIGTIENTVNDLQGDVTELERIKRERERRIAEFDKAYRELVVRIGNSEDIVGECGEAVGGIEEILKRYERGNDTQGKRTDQENAGSD